MNVDEVLKPRRVANLLSCPRMAGVTWLGNATGKTAGFQNRKTGFVRTQKTGFGGFNFGCQNCTQKRAEMYFIEILEAKRIAFAIQILTSKFQVKVLLGLVQTNIFGVILCNLHNVICSYCFCSSQFII